VWKRPDTSDPLSEQQLMPIISWVRATAVMNPAAAFLIVATHSNTPRPGESLSAYKNAFESMLKAVDSRIKVELQRIQESFNLELAELQRTIEKLKARLAAQEIKKRKLGSP
jgi:cell shape-determining protein MreC